MAKKKKLDEYERKRDFKKTPEPTGSQAATDEPIFVVQKHDASRLHYDFRLEIDGTLVSWAVPKGPSTDTKNKRLAVHVEDHPLDYAAFEGVIPDEEYGGGTVMVWDAGTVRYLGEGSPGEQLAGGFIEFELVGRKLRGRWKLIHTKMGGQDKNWLLVKGRDEHASAEDILVEQPDSAKTGRSLEQIAADGK
jgi:bifunctional non-homologous end joining protein LigD